MVESAEYGNASASEGELMFYKREPLFTVEYHEWGVISCLPTYMDKSDLIEVTAISDSFTKYVSRTVPGKIYDSAEFYKKAMGIDGA